MLHKLIKLGWLYPSTNIYKRADISLEEIEKFDLRVPRSRNLLVYLLKYPYLQYKKRKLWEKIMEKYNIVESTPEFVLSNLEASIDIYKTLIKLIENPEFVNELKATNEGKDVLEILFRTPDVTPEDIRRNKELYKQLALLHLDDIKRLHSILKEWKEEVTKI